MYGKPFNEKRPFGTVIGDPRFSFDQDGQLFNTLKQPVDASGNLMPLDAKIEAEIPVIYGEPVVTNDPADDIPADEMPIDLLAWANGDPALQSIPFAKIKAETGALIGDQTGLNSKDACKKAILAYYGLN